MKEGRILKSILLTVSLLSSTFAIGSFAYSLNTSTKADSSSMTYKLVTDFNYLKDGDEVIIVGINNENYFAMGYQKSNNRYAVDLQDNDASDGLTLNSKDIDNGIQLITIVKNDINNFSFEVSSTGHNDESGTVEGYLYAPSSSDNYLKTRNSNTTDDKSKFACEINNSTQSHDIKAGVSTRNWLRFNSTSSLFSCYGSGQKDVYIYKNIEDYGVALELDGGTGPSSASITDNKVVKPSNPTKDGYQFVGWSTTGDINNLYDFNTTVYEEFTLTAVWAEQGTSLIDLSIPKSRLGVSYYTESYAGEQTKTVSINPTLLYGNSNYTEDTTSINQLVPEIAPYVDISYKRNGIKRGTLMMDDNRIRLYNYSTNGSSLEFNITKTTNFKFDSIKVKFKIYDQFKDETSASYAGLKINDETFTGSLESQEVEVTNLEEVSNLVIQNVYNTTSYDIIDIEKITITYKITNAVKYYFTEVNLRTLIYIPINLDAVNNMSEFGFKVNANGKNAIIQVDLEENKTVSGDYIVYTLALNNIPYYQFKELITITPYAVINEAEHVMESIEVSVEDVIYYYRANDSTLDEEDKLPFYALLNSIINY